MTEQGKDREPIVVLGATGTTGSQVARLLDEAGEDVRRASRSSDRRFDWNDPRTWAPVVDGARSIYVVLPEESLDLSDFVDVLSKQGVENAVVLTARNPSVSGDGIASGAEEVFAASSVTTAFLRPSWFAQGFTTGFFAAQLDATGELRLPVGEGREPFIDSDDIARVAASILQARPTENSYVELSGPQSLSFAEAVEIVGARTGRSLRFVDIELAEWRAAVGPYLRPPMVDALSNLFDAIRDGRDDYLSTGVEQTLGAAPQTLAAVVDRHRSAGQAN